MWECLNYSLIFKRTVLVAIIFLVNRFLFFLYTLIILSHCLLAFKLSAEKSIDNFTENFLHMMSLCLWMLSRFSLWFSQFDYNMSWSGSLDFWISLCFLYLYIHVFSQIWEIFDHYVFWYTVGPFLSLSSLSGISIMHILIY